MDLHALGDFEHINAQLGIIPASRVCGRALCDSGPQAGDS
jgi:hypothetical protein